MSEGFATTDLILFLIFIIFLKIIGKKIAKNGTNYLEYRDSTNILMVGCAVAAVLKSLVMQKKL